jgi:methylmalonyl-CoA mutase N-terminal domain/subunit
MLDAIQSQWVQGQIQDTAFERQREIEDGERVIVGVNDYRVEEDDEPEMELEEVSEEDERRQVERLTAVREERDDEAVDAALAALRDAAAGDANVLPPIVDAVKAYATVGEISDVLRDEFGEHSAV